MSSELARLEARLVDAIQSLSAVQTQASPRDRPGCWNIQQIVEHLALTYQLTCTTFEVRVAKGTPTRAKRTFSQRVGQFVLLRLGYFPPGREAPEAVVPSTPFHLRSGAELAGMVHAELESLDALIVRAEELFGDRRAISHQILEPLSASQWRTFHLVHGLHHVKQIHAILDERSRD